jgi:hypothetical protein
MKMSDQDREVSLELHGAIRDFMDNSSRSRQRVIGISELGTCRELTRRKLLELPESNPGRVAYSAFIGSAVGDWGEQAFLAKWPGGLRQLTVVVRLPSGRYELTGHPDVVWTTGGPYDGPTVLDGKTSDGLTLVEKDGASDQQRYQKALYALGLHQMGVFGETPVEEIVLANAWIDRSGREDRFHVESELFTWALAEAAEEFVDDVVYAVENRELASRDKPWNWCEKVCPFFDDCRGTDTDVSGLIEDQESVSAVEMYVEAKELEKRAAKMKDEASAKLRGLTGNTKNHSLRWVHINEQERKAFTVKAFDRIDVRKLKGR